MLPAQSLPCAPAPAVPGQSVLATVRADYTPLLHLRIMPHLGVWKLVAAVEEHPHAQPDEAERQEEGSHEEEKEKHKKGFLLLGRGCRSISCIQSQSIH